MPPPQQLEQFDSISRKNSSQCDFCETSIEMLTLESDDVVSRVNAPCQPTKHIKKAPPKDLSYRNKTKQLEKKVEELTLRVQDLEAQNLALRREKEGLWTGTGWQQLPPYQDLTHIGELFKSAGACQARTKSNDSVRFETLDLMAPLTYTAEIEGRTWVFVGALMMAMGSSCMAQDGTVHVYKMLREAVDLVRRQIQTSQPRIELDFYLSQEGLPDNVGGQFDHFFNSHQTTQGLVLDSLRLQSHERFELGHEEHVKFGINYDTLLTMMELARGNCFIFG